MQKKITNLKNILLDLNDCLIAFSGGVDSTFLLKMAQMVLGDKVEAVSIKTELMKQSEMESIPFIAEEIGAKCTILNVDILDKSIFQENPADRCYHCKKLVFSEIREFAEEKGIKNILDGTNADDALDYRPGLKALGEMKIISPLKEAGITKEEIRLFSERLGLSTWKKPAQACLASRVPYGEPITYVKLYQIEQAEEFLADMGFTQCRVRHFGKKACLEFVPEEMMLYELDKSKIVQTMNKLGFSEVEASIYEQGKLNKGLK